jgi:hypothetical protein
VLAQGQGADTLGHGRANVGGEVGYGAVGSMWNASNTGDPDVNTGPVGTLRVRYGLIDNVDVGVVGAVGPMSTLVVSPEVKWRFAHLVDGSGDDAPAFHASLVSGVGFGTSLIQYSENRAYVAPYTGLLVSAGIPVVQMFTGLRVAVSETLGDLPDLTVYPVLAFGVQCNPTRSVRLFVEGDLGAAYTSQATEDSAILGYAVGGASVTFDTPLAK